MVGTSVGDIEMTTFILVKGKIVTKTKNIYVVTGLKALGWKVKQSELGELL